MEWWCSSLSQGHVNHGMTRTRRAIESGHDGITTSPDSDRPARVTTPPAPEPRSTSFSPNASVRVCGARASSVLGPRLAESCFWPAVQAHASVQPAPGHRWSSEIEAQIEAQHVQRGRTLHSTRGPETQPYGRRVSERWTSGGRADVWTSRCVSSEADNLRLRCGKPTRQNTHAVSAKANSRLATIKP